MAGISAGHCVGSRRPSGRHVNELIHLKGAIGDDRVADHNDPNAVNSIFSDIDVSAADLYDLFGFPADDDSNGERVVIALTFP